ncbi:MAG: LicD family protein [Erysipelotrichaceae bacterium]|nr:LicD family protein [Erysipelotrichaceae bacterium]
MIFVKKQFNIFLIAGSALGAIRHNGMIPWDDDIDIGLLYDDWIRLKEILPQELVNSDFEFADVSVCKSFTRMQAKILYKGRNCVDLFLIAKWTTNPVDSVFHWYIRCLSTRMPKYYLNYKSSVKRQSVGRKIERITGELILKLWYLLTKNIFTIDLYIHLARWNERYYEKRNFDCYINLYSCYSRKKELLKKEWVEQLEEHMFEGQKYKIVGHTHEYLTHLYGNYMIPPPIEDQISYHEENFNNQL